METVPILTMEVNNSGVGKGLGTPPKRTVAKFYKKNDKPMAEIKIEI